MASGLHDGLHGMLTLRKTGNITTNALKVDRDWSRMEEG